MRALICLLALMLTGVSEQAWQSSFAVDKTALSATGTNPYFNLTPGFRLHYRHAGNTLTTTVLAETKLVDGVKTRVVEDRETKNGKLVEVTRDYYAIDSKTNDVYYFGEDVDNYKDGKVVNHESEWRAGENGARFGLMITGSPRVGDRFYQEIAPKVAMDRVEIVSTDETVKTPAGTFEHCVHLKETTPMEADVSHKWYAPGIGMVKDDEFELAERP